MNLKALPAYFAQRRRKLMKANPKSAFIFPSNPMTIRNHDVGYPYRQDSSLYYLTGLEEPQSALILYPDSKNSDGFSSALFVHPKDPKLELWEGKRFGPLAAQEYFKIATAYSIHELGSKLPELLKEANQLGYRLGLFKSQDELVLQALETVKKNKGRTGAGLTPIFDPSETLGELRLIKSTEEITALKKATQVTAQAHLAAMKQARPGMNERDVQAIVEFEFRRGGCAREGYTSIIAGGANSTCLHYVKNDQPLKDGDLLLIDAGGEYDYYTADITRTFPVGARFNPIQQKVYDLVLKVQTQAIQMVKPGLEYRAIHETTCKRLAEGLLELGLLKGDPGSHVQNGGQSESLKRFYPHGTGHWLGMDVHDIGLYLQNGSSRKLEPGMVFTIEPGLYFQVDDDQVPNEYRGIGIRIEDDILVTQEGCEVLTQGVPKLREEIESLRSQKGR